MKKIIIALIITFTAGYMGAQEVITIAGDEFHQPGFSLNFTIGEPVAETLQVDDVILTQGFQQPWNFGFDQWIIVVEGWSGISGYIEPNSKDLDFLFEDHLDQLVVLSNFNGIYFPSQGINTLFFWNHNTGYQVKADDEFDLRLRGWHPDNTSLELEAGWHILPVLSACNVAVDGGLGDGVNIQIVKEIAGNKIFWPEYGINTIVDLLPGKAYYLLLSDLSIMQFPDCTPANKGLITTDAEKVNLSCWPSPSPTPQSHLVMISREFISALKIAAGDYIGGFTSSGRCAGVVEISNPDENHCLTLFADDPLTLEQDGFFAEEPISLKLFNALEKTETAIEAVFDPSFPNQGFFANHGISALKAGQLAIGSLVGDSELEFNIFPNPAREEITISWPSKNQEQWQLLIYNAYGQLVKDHKSISSFSGNQHFTLDISGLDSGTYSVSLKTGNRTGYQTIIIIH